MTYVSKCFTSMMFTLFPNKFAFFLRIGMGNIFNVLRGLVYLFIVSNFERNQKDMCVFAEPGKILNLHQVG